MTAIAKLEGLSGTRYKAIIRRGGRVLKTKIFRPRRSATSWARQVEADHELIEALGCPGAGITLTELVDKYFVQWQGKDQATPQRVR
jgi:hypothetical protein